MSFQRRNNIFIHETDMPAKGNRYVRDESKF